MTFALAAAGTGGHVFPALAVSEALIDLGVSPDEIVFFGGDRFAAEAVPSAGLPFERLPLRGLQRRVTAENLKIPGTVWAARTRAREVLQERDVRVVLAAGGYVTVPVALAARSLSVPYFLQEQNAHAGLANRLMARWAVEVFTSFPETEGLPRGRHVGNPVRRPLAHFSRPDLRAESLARYGFLPDRVTLGVVGGSLGAAVLNEAVVELVRSWEGPPLQIVHLAGRRNADAMQQIVAATELPPTIRWSVVPFEDRMECFFAASDLVLARAGGMVAELTATGSPAVLVPGGFGSRGHQDASADYLASHGAALVVDENDRAGLLRAVRSLVEDPSRRRTMAEASRRVGRPEAAAVIAGEMVDAHG